MNWNRVRVKLPYDSKYLIKKLYRDKVNVYSIEYYKDYTIIEVDYESLQDINLNNIEIVGVYGLRKLLLTVKINKHFLISILISIIIMVFLSNVCFSVVVIHNDKDIRVLLLDELYDLGIKPLTFKKSYGYIQEVKVRIKKMYPEDIEWLEIVDDGMKYTIRVEERIITKEKEKIDYCDVIAKKDATILNIVNSSGQSIVNINQVVKKDDILISGDIKFNEEVKNRVCADGKVYGNTWYRVSVSVPLVYIEKEYTKNNKYNIGFEYGSYYNRIFRIHYDKYDVVKKKLFSIGKFTLYKEKVREYNEKKKKYSIEEATRQAKKKAREYLKINIGEEIKVLDEKVLQTEDYNSIISIEFFYSIRENIGVQIKKE